MPGVVLAMGKTEMKMGEPPPGITHRLGQGEQMDILIGH